MPATYEPVATTTISGNTTTSVTFSSIPSTYTDLILVIGGNAAGNNSNPDVFIQFNGDTATNYSRMYMYGSGSSAISGRDNNQTGLGILNIDSSPTIAIIAQFLNYSNTTTFKTGMSRINGATRYGTAAVFGTWRSTAAINSMRIYFGNSSIYYADGTTLTLYGVKAA